MTNIHSMKNTVERMRLDEVVAYCSIRGYMQTATYFMGTIRNHELYDVILSSNAYWINTRSVQDYLPEEFFKDIQRKVSTWMPEA
jgi:hypothetical protein